MIGVVCHRRGVGDEFLIFPIRSVVVVIFLLPHQKIYLKGDSLPHEKNYLKSRKMTSTASGERPGERGVSNGVNNGDQERAE
jgi:hypothetical protein